MYYNQFFSIKDTIISFIYTFDFDSVADLMLILSQNLQKRRLEKNVSRAKLSELSGIPIPTIAKFEKTHRISLESYVALCKALGYTNEIKALLSEPKYNTMQELETINQNKNRKRGRNEAGK